MTQKKMYYLVLMPEDCDIQEFHTVEDLVEEIKNILDNPPENSRMRIIYGEKILFSKGGQRYLLLPDGRRVPLFDAPEYAEPDNEGIISKKDVDPEYEQLTKKLKYENLYNDDPPWSK